MKKIILINSILFSLICILIFILIYVILKDYTPIKNINISIIIFLIFLIFFLNSEIKKYFIIIFSSFIFSLYLFEINFMYNIVGFDYRNKIDSYFKLKQNDNDVRLFNLTLFKKEQIQTLSGISNVRTINCNEDGYYSIYLSDRYGFNNLDSEHNKKIIKFLLLGDSFAMGDCVNRPNDIASRLLNYESEKGVLTFSYPGTGILAQYATLREYLIPNVENVILFFFEGNDIQNLNDEIQNPILIKYLKDMNFSQNLKKNQNKLDNLMKSRFFDLVEKKKISKKQTFINFIKLYQLRRFFFGSNRKEIHRQIANNNLIELKEFNEDSKNLSRLFHHFEYILNLINDLLKKQNTNLTIVYLPQYERYSVKYDNIYYKKLKDIAKRNRIKFIDVHEEIFQKEKNFLRLFPHIKGHYNKEGYKQISDLIYKNIN